MSARRALLFPLLVGLVALSACGTHGDASQPSAPATAINPTRQASASTHERGDAGAPLGYYVSLPASYKADGTTPAVIALHGCCQMDAADVSVLPNEPVPVAQKHTPALADVVVFAPQHVTVGDPESWERWCPDTSDATCGFQLQHDREAQLKGTPCTTPAEVHQFISFAVRTYRVDPSRIYLTGFSCGGFATFEYLAKYGATQVAAALPISGDGRPALASVGCALSTVPLWVIHGDADDVVPINGSKQVVDRLKACPGHAELKFTVYPGVKHDAWLTAYDDPNTWAWLLAQHRPNM